MSSLKICGSILYKVTKEHFANLSHAMVSHLKNLKQETGEMAFQ